jgi:hypothetical protein
METGFRRKSVPVVCRVWPNAQEESESQHGVAMRARIHDLLLDEAGHLLVNHFLRGDIGGLVVGLIEGDDLLAVRTLGHADSSPNENSECGISAMEANDARQSQSYRH